jgi:AraC-like DNA-binding protein
MASRLEDYHLKPEEIRQRAGLPAGFFQQERILVSTEELFALWRAIGDSSDDPVIGLKIGSESRLERNDPAAIAALCSQSFHDAIERMARYKQLTCPEKIRVRTGKTETTVEFVFLLAPKAEPAVLVDVCLAWILSIGQRGTGLPLSPLRVELARPAMHRELLESHFRCPIHFNSKHNALVLRAGDLTRPFITHNADLLQIIGSRLDAELEDQNASLTLRERVKNILKRLLAGKRPALGDVARQLGLSTRTLQRRLTENGISFLEILEEVRRELAHHYLQQGSIELSETAYLLGYEDANSFFRAFQLWEGTTPGQWRQNSSHSLSTASGRVLR